MAQDATNRRFVLNKRPTGEPSPDTFRLETTDIPAPAEGQMLLRNHYLSLDPYMRGRLDDRKSYAEPVALNEVMIGGTVSQVVDSRHPDYAKGDWVVTTGGWQDYALSDGALTFPLKTDMGNKSWALGILGMPGFTAWAGLTQIGQPKEGETLVVAAATGPVGSAVGQIGKLLGLRVVGVAGGPEKCAYAMENFGFDACIDHKAADFEEQLAKATPDGIDIYFENVGGRVFDAVLPLLNMGARIPLCGTIATYNNADEPSEGRDRTGLVMAKFLQSRVTVRGYIIFDDFGHLYGDFMSQMSGWVAEGKLHYLEHMTDGLEDAPEALNQVLRGENFGKRVIRITEDAA
ncbi:NADP-dependent oxidoreductase [Palleronia caenipelagi]|uniref:NADP-dependent oxidoreductase n=1 Tax=Palleronia caenipelagi TaxID=2489174 RepID=A0A547Q8U0_9RHOB|nr:NADP-dependent oxidoreductase [Palleronia caenipelagi]TRD22773.1 NADP-dependent oxidoreductase [Palleronia caenipelagi]